MEEASENDAREADLLQEGDPAPGRRPVQLPLLWLICVVFGLLGAVSTYGAFVRDPFVPGLPRPVLPAVAPLVFFALAVGLWVRWNPARFATILCAAGLCLLFLHEAVGCAFKCQPSWPFAVGWGAIAVYLCTLGKYFRASSDGKPKVVSPAFAAAVAAVVLLFLLGLANDAVWAIR